jgi:hypothetical protein
MRVKGLASFPAPVVWRCESDPALCSFPRAGGWSLPALKELAAYKFTTAPFLRYPAGTRPLEPESTRVGGQTRNGWKFGAYRLSDFDAVEEHSHNAPKKFF